MVADVDLCNRALSEIGTRSTITSLSEPSPEAINCALWYTPMRKRLLRTAHWGFSRTQISLSMLGNAAAGTAPFPYLYEYAYPSDCIKIRYLVCVPQGWPFPISAVSNFVQTGDTVVVPMFAPSRKNRFIVSTDLINTIRTRVILSNVYQAIGVYSADIVDPDLFDDMFADALVAAVATKIVVPLTGNFQMKTEFAQIAQNIIDQARASDANEARPTTNHTPDWIKARGFQNDWYFSGGDPSSWWGSWYGDWEELDWGM